MRVGVLAVSDPHGGGIYQYSLSILWAISQLRDGVEPVIVQDGATRNELRAWSRSGWRVINSRPRTPRTMARRAVVAAFGEAAAVRTAAVARKATGRSGTTRSGPPLAEGTVVNPRPQVGAWLRRNGIDLMLYPVPTTYSFESGVPYVMAIHDLQHRIHPEFPEVSADGEWAAREYLFATGVRRAEAILVDSEVGREDVLAFYGHLTSPDRVRVLPFVPPPYLARPPRDDVTARLRSLGLPDRYLLFPAQLWPHKNHLRVTEAVAALHRDGLDFTVVMTGSATGRIRAGVLAGVCKIVEREQIADQVRILGYVDDVTIATLYAGAWGVILPTFFGPTNIPVIEGWAMGVPVLTSDIRGIREQCDDAAILVDPLSAEAIADGMRRLWMDDALRARLISAGTERMKENDATMFRDRLAGILADVEHGLRANEPRTVPA